MVFFIVIGSSFIIIDTHYNQAFFFSCLMDVTSHSSSFTYAFTYDVFLSFRGSDTRHGFTGNLYKALDDKGIHTFIDDEELQGGDQITPSLLKAIGESRIAITVLSTNYASSSFCLDELANILDCYKTKCLLVLPVFYNVDPSDVRHKKGSYGEALTRHEERFKAKMESLKHNMERMEKWKWALNQVANLSGYHFRHGDGYEYTFIGRIVELVSNKIKRAPLHVADYPVGLESQVLEVRNLLEVGSNDVVHMIGIHGIGGIGKTTLAITVYNSIADHFDGLCFLENVRENSKKHGLQHLQSILLLEILGEKESKLASVRQGISVMQHRFQRKKVLLILDDVDKHDQFQALVGSPNWFGLGSRVIITTRDKQLLACHGVTRTYEVKELNEQYSLQFLRWKAFQTDMVDASYVDVLNRVVAYASGLPLALEVIGSNLFGKSVEEWESAINKYKRIPNNQILKILKVSFDALEDEEKSVFLDIACCFKGYALREVEDILHVQYGDCMKYHIGVLVEKSLIKLLYGTVTMHDLIEDMGKGIVIQKSPKEPGKRSRLWLWKDIVQVLEDNSGTTEIEILCLNYSIRHKDERVEWNGKAFKKMKNIKTLIIKSGVFSQGPKYLPKSLRVLEWIKYPSQGLPHDFHSKKLAICKLPESCFGSLELADLAKKFANISVLNFDDCDGLTQISDVSGLPNLENFSFQGCENLVAVHDSIGFLDKLKVLNARGCSKLKSFPPLMLISLEELQLSLCSSLESFPEILGKMENITNLVLEASCIKELPLSFRNFTGLQTLQLRLCGMLRLPSCILMMPKLAEIISWQCEGFLLPNQIEGEENVLSMVSSNVDSLYLSGCNLSDNFFQVGFTLFANIKDLDISRNAFTVLPECISDCNFLWRLNLDYCEHLQEIRGIPPNVKDLSALNCKSLTYSSRSTLLNQELHESGNTRFLLPGASIPEWFEHINEGWSNSFWFRNKFPAIALCIAIEPSHDKYITIVPIVSINGIECLLDTEVDPYLWMETDHTYLCDLQKLYFVDNLNKRLKENEWNHVEIMYKVKGLGEEEKPVEIPVYIFKKRSSMEDIRFTDPYSKKRKFDDVS